MSDSFETGQLSRELVAALDPAGVAVEAYRTLRTNLFYSFVDNPPRAISVTSPGPGEGKSTTCANLGVVLAQAEKRTLIMDCDLRKSAMHKIFGLRNFKGIADVLTKSVSLREIAEEPLPGLKVLTAGPASRLSRRSFWAPGVSQSFWAVCARSSTTSSSTPRPWRWFPIP